MKKLLRKETPLFVKNVVLLSIVCLNLSNVRQMNINPAICVILDSGVSQFGFQIYFLFSISPFQRNRVKWGG